MITLTKNGNAVKFQFEDSQHYLMGDGEIEVPVNSLSLIIDESEFVTFKKASSDDIFVSFDPADSNLSTKAGVIQFYKENMVGSTGGGSGSGVTSGEVQTMIDASLEDYPTIDDVDETLEDYYDKDEVDAGFASIQDEIDEKEEVISTSLNDLNDRMEDKAETSAVTALNSSLTAHTADTTIHVTSSDKTAWSAKQEALVSGTNIKTINGESVLGSGNITISGGTDTGTVQTMIEDYFDPKEEVIATSLVDLNDRLEDLETGGSSVVIASAITSSSTNSEAAGALATYNAITAATTGGGATYSAGRNISIDTANTISCTLRASNGTGNGSLKLAPLQNTNASGLYSVAAGYDTVVSGNYSFGAGRGCKTNNYGEAAFGFNNKSNGTSSSFGNNSGNTLFSVGNGQGTSPSDLHNAFEIRQNGDIYFPDTDNTTYQKPMVRLQDMYGALGGLKFVKLSQSEYDQLATKDSNTLYIVSNVVS